MANKELNYTNYLCIDEITSLQNLISEQQGKEPAHIEMLYIIVHQVYELWFKEILHEVGSVIGMFEADFVNEQNIGISVRRLKRVSEIQKLLIQQIGVLETMTPLEFLDFRNFLGTASGFQSLQYRLLENRLGLQPDARIRYANKDYHEEFGDQKLDLLKKSEQDPSLFDVIANWLERTPFIHLGDFDFTKAYRDATTDMVNRQKEQISKDQSLSDEQREIGLTALQDTAQGFEAFLDPEEHERMMKNGHRRLSHKATLAALFINLYRDEPILQLPFQLLETLVDIDENFTVWRNRHAVMVQRMLGRKMGTGQSSGYDYLKRTVDKYRVFTDLFNLSTFLIPRSELPELPAELKQNLGFHYSAKR